MKSKAFFLALSLSIGLTGFAGLASAKSAIRTLTPDRQIVLSQHQIEGIQAILATYHDIDASLSDAVHLANSGSFGTAYQGISTMPGLFSGIDANDREFNVSPVLPVPIGMQDTQIMLKHFDTTTLQLSPQLTGNGYLHINPSGSVQVDSQRLANNIRWRIWADPGLKTLQGIDLSEQKVPFSAVTGNQLVRLGTRDKDLSAGLFNPIVNVNTPLGVFTTRANVIGADRDVLLSGTKEGMSGPEMDLILHQRGPGPNQTAYRVIDQLADGSKRIVTQVVSNLAGGAKLEVLEERVVNPQGVGIGTGVVQLNERFSAPTELGQIRTMVQSDGSLVSHLDLVSGPDVMVYESGQGQASVATLGTGEVPVWNTLILPAFASELNRIDNWVEDLIDTQDDDRMD
ncbi:MAG: hypothetical protein CVV27_08850 [Candidatus Melainabacteria bacterium HGW-Melainabacteria-1]|nr:MAG: hypothetical protein CVV27_08850 [Candidatus Melainabacteria bacterium HGW-Melainabacteria-1]